jgi:hypothetical protein
VSIDPSTRKADNTTMAGSHSAGCRENADSEKLDSTSVAPRSRVPRYAFQPAVRYRHSPPNNMPTRKLVPVPSTRPATAAPVMPPSAYNACSHCSTGLRVTASSRCPSTLRNTSISPLPAPTITNAIQSAAVGSNAIATAPVPRVISPSAHSAPSGNRASLGVTKAMTAIATSDSAARRSPIEPYERACISWMRTTRMTHRPQYWPKAQ